jgi:hypothetical protein
MAHESCISCSMPSPVQTLLRGMCRMSLETLQCAAVTAATIIIEHKRKHYRKRWMASFLERQNWNLTFRVLASWNGQAFKFPSRTCFLFLDCLSHLNILLSMPWAFREASLILNTPCLKFWIAHFPNFTTLPKIWLLMKLLFSSNGGWFSNYIPKKRKCFSFNISKLCDSTGYTCDMKVYLGRDRKLHSTARDSNPCDSDRTDEEDRRMWPQIIRGKFLFFRWIIWWYGK